MAMKFNLNELNPGTFFPFEEDNPEEGGVTLRVLNQEKLEEINRATQVRKSEVKGSPPTRFEFMQYKPGGEDRAFEMTWDYCLVDWSKVIDSEGKEIPCTKENKVKLMRGSADFASFILKCTRKLNQIEEEEEEELEKN